MATVTESAAGSGRCLKVEAEAVAHSLAVVAAAIESVATITAPAQLNFSVDFNTEINPELGSVVVAG